MRRLPLVPVLIWNSVIQGLIASFLGENTKKERWCCGNYK